jgi:hypothetical protein
MGPTSFVMARPGKANNGIGAEKNAVRGVRSCWSKVTQDNRLQHGNPDGVLADRADALEVEGWPDTARDILRTV